MKFNKYHSRKALYDGLKFDSQHELTRYLQLVKLQEERKISDLQTQVRYELIPSQRDALTGKVIERAVTYKADFVYIDNATAERVVEDAKGYKTKDYIIKRKLMLERYGIKIKEV